MPFSNKIKYEKHPLRNINKQKKKHGTNITDAIIDKIKNVESLEKIARNMHISEKITIRPKPQVVKHIITDVPPLK